MFLSLLFIGMGSLTTGKGPKDNPGELQVDEFHSGTSEKHGMCPLGVYVMPHEGEEDDGEL